MGATDALRLTRRGLLGAAASLLAGAAGRPRPLWAARSAAAPRRTVPWRNWSGAQECEPTARVAPASEEALAELVRAARHTIRPVGAGHSFSPLVPTDGTIVALSRLSGIVSHDPATLRADVWAGTRMAELGPPLAALGQALENMADIDRQLVGGAVATATHGTGLELGSISTTVRWLRLVTASGEVVECSADRNPELFQAARASLGALGIVTQLRLQNRRPYRLREKVWIMKTEDVLEASAELRTRHRHFETFPMVHGDMSLVETLDETDDEPTPVEEQDDGGAALAALADLASRFPSLRGLLANLLAWLVEPGERVGESWQLLASVRNTRFNEMEYAVPLESGPDCLREVLATIERENIDVFFPLEFRYVKGDDIWLSPFYGRDSCAISVHQFHARPYADYFAAVEPVFWKYDGRPHWGKLHTLEARELSGLYPRWRDFLEVRLDLDPYGKFLNDHLRGVFGEPA